VLDRIYLRPAGTQEGAAQDLDLPISTYRRHLARGLDRVVEWLWQRELYRWPDRTDGAHHHVHSVAAAYRARQGLGRAAAPICGKRD